MIATMARKQTPKLPKNSEAEWQYSLRATQGLRYALEQLASKRRRSINMLIVLMLEDELRKEGLWPPPGSS